LLLLPEKKINGPIMIPPMAGIKNFQYQGMDETIPKRFEPDPKKIP
jgi:hypothetical protein